MPDVAYLNGARVEPHEAVMATGLAVHEESISRERLRRMQEVFLMSTSHEVCPVVDLDGAPVGDGRVGPTVQRLLAGFRERVAAGDDSPREARRDT